MKNLIWWFESDWIWEIITRGLRKWWGFEDIASRGWEADRIWEIEDLEGLEMIELRSRTLRVWSFGIHNHRELDPLEIHDQRVLDLLGITWPTGVGSFGNTWPARCWILWKYMTNEMLDLLEIHDQLVLDFFGNTWPARCWIFWETWPTSVGSSWENTWPARCQIFLKISNLGKFKSELEFCKKEGIWSEDWC